MTSNAETSYASASSRTRDLRLGWIDLAKGTCIVLVVLLHTTNYLVNRGMANPLWHEVNAFFEPVRMPLFFLAAGMLGANALRLSFVDLVRRKVLPLLYLYALWVVLRFVFFSVFPATAGTAETASPFNLVRAIAVPTSGLWFLYALAVFAMLAWTIRRLPPSVQLLGAVALTLWAANQDVLDWTWHNMCSLLVFYLLGIHAGGLLQASAPRWRYRHAVAALAVFAVLLTIATGIAFTRTHAAAVAVTVALIGVFAALVVAKLVEDTRIVAPIRALGPRTLPIYLLHEVMLGSIAATTVAIGVDFTTPAVQAIAPVAISVLACGGSLCAHTVLVRGGHRWLFHMPR
ncbi:acyltransferase family protein [Prescottella equi]